MILLDTHSLIWWVSNKEKLSAISKKKISSAALSQSIYISSISIWEIMLLDRKKKISLSMDATTWLQQITTLPEITLKPIDFEIAHLAATLDYPHKDPADRFILATAQSLAIPLITKDKHMHTYSQVETIW
ncbi:MAG: VapC toxin family PIN domain ribonuclease [Candidatus Pacebacteria bacterium CG10_big_fil_rev_8_21_14_0_10_42_12]|nr:type II toxin-antitoxin system VapC family toxin [Candidatus Paceibacterota bacterium]PIR62227.1 MAG: VapC toxin family PIN domain ribonuclease [Candidatus Pacebacteria bacterium CG10_big_fil_rev_8_21_14_0_10_42_12]